MEGWGVGGGGEAGRETAGSGPRYPSSGHKSPRASLPSAASWEFALRPCSISTWVIVFVPILGVAVPCEAHGRRQQQAMEAAVAEPQAGQAEAAAGTEHGRRLAKDAHNTCL